MEDHVALNRVRAHALQAELTREYNKKEWRNAIEVERARFLANGGKIEHVTPRPKATRTSRSYFIW